MVKSTDLQTSMAAGILGAALHDREDVEEYFEGVLDMHNMDPRPQGGAALRPGLAFYGELRKVLALIDLDGATITAGAQLEPGVGTGDAPTPPADDPSPYIDLPDWNWDFSGLQNIGPG